jgi:predicted  nucleic acid-binding Zn-ribbon protein
MSTTQTAATLFQLQLLDLELDRLVAEQQSLTSSLQSSVPLKKARAEYAIAQQQLSHGLQTQKEAEWALADLEQRLKQQEGRLYSGSVTNPKELYALQQEIHHLRAQQARQEEMTLEMMEAAETLRGELSRRLSRPGNWQTRRMWRAANNWKPGNRNYNRNEQHSRPRSTTR